MLFDSYLEKSNKDQAARTPRDNKSYENILRNWCFTAL